MRLFFIVFAGSYADYDRWAKANFPYLMRVDSKLSPSILYAGDGESVIRLLGLERNTPYIILPSFWRLPAEDREAALKTIRERKLVRLELAEAI